MTTENEAEPTVARPTVRRHCSLAAALDVLGERWTMLAVREMGYGEHRFDRIAAFTGASRDILAGRLRTLEHAGVVARRQYSEHPPRHEYHLTEAGRELLPVLRGLYEWGDKWVAESPSLPSTPRSTTPTNPAPA